MTSDLELAIEAIDAANADDPRRWADEPLARAQGRLAHEWVIRLDPAAPAALQIAARAHHLRRWVVPRSAYPEGRAGYLRWRRDQKARHADELSWLLTEAGVGVAVVERAAAIVAKVGLGTDRDVQTFEDAVCLAFLATELEPTAERLDRDRMIAVVQKTLAKMSPAGRAAALTIELDAVGADVVGAALATGGVETDAAT